MESLIIGSLVIGVICKPYYRVPYCMRPYYRVPYYSGKSSAVRVGHLQCDFILGRTANGGNALQMEAFTSVTDIMHFVPDRAFTGPEIWGLPTETMWAYHRITTHNLNYSFKKLNNDARIINE